ncbi:MULTISPECIES: immunity 22 family protein [Bacillus]|uniref:Uncharacterized protein n=1 Tax=Bacillus pseudomycoides TaxID=64104 RepID=A0AAJ2DKY7_9BACI|nr:immunity 22 family protein [Bacillus pseudomycoides]EEM02904.1 hypothetical protein bmyco0002_47100 [Bacillus pseudomycoides]EEM08410.1 hypothetical protein bmyco0003_48900 [Bacillus pseudomycoides]KFN13448.1 hypothetical protein DJ94_4606 [Bacillus pseudomycoides]MCR8857878.1 immunity 22 family protein [Bacillus pseudomycoides]MDR4189787.1 hypothetical protein [Bacillus pseudomycoides]
MNEKVTVWIGNFESNDEFENYTNIKYTEDGDSIPSIFEQHFNLGYYDRDLVEKKWIFQPLTNNIQDVLKGFHITNNLLNNLIMLTLIKNLILRF